ncbi:MAG TPA: response regulator transcription factor [Candidatus Atribacteria bacterium]|nr:response regulator transcription factor [Candidatus Atribacteria bacterium]
MLDLRNREIKVFLVDDNRLFIEGLSVLLARRKNFKIVGMATRGKEALEKIGKIKPDLVIMDVVLPDASGIDLTGEIISCWPQIKVVVLSIYDDPEFQKAALEKGAFAYLVKGGSINHLIETLNRAFIN